MKEFLKKYTPLLVCIVVLGIFAVVGVNQENRHDRVLAEQHEKIASLENTISVKEDAIETDKKAVETSMTGLNHTRKQKDDEIAKEFMKGLFNWTTLDEYNEVRSKLMTDYNLTEEDSVLRDFMPKVLPVNVNGKDINEIDSGLLNTEFESMDTIVERVGLNNYDYLAEVKVNSTRQGYSSTKVVAFTYSVDVDGNLHDLQAYVLK